MEELKKLKAAAQNRAGGAKTIDEETLKKS